MADNPLADVLTPVRKKHAGMHPNFTKDNAGEMARRSQAVQKRKREEAKQRAEELKKLAGEEALHLPGRAEIKTLAEQALAKMLLMVVAGTKTPRTGAEAVSMARGLLDVIRLEEGKPSAAQSGEQPPQMDRGAIEAHVKDLFEQAERKREQNAVGVMPDAGQ